MLCRKVSCRLLVVASIVIVAGADWPQWRGPNRTEISTETGLLKTWPANGPTLVWTNTEAGSGYSGPAVVGDRLYVLGADETTEGVLCLDTASGKVMWRCEIGPRFKNGWGDGPRGTPTIDGKRLYAIGGQGILVCADAETGKLTWKVRLKEDLGGRMMSGWGYTESPLIDGDRVICTPGGSKGTLAALDKATGKVIWRSSGLTDDAAYSSIVAGELAGLRQYVQMTGKAVVGVAAKDGKFLWRNDNTSYRTAVIPTAIISGDLVYATSGYGAGCDLVKVEGSPDDVKATKVYSNKNMVNHHGGVVLVGEHVYGYSDGKGWVCQNLKTGEIVWAEKGKLGKGSVTCVDGKLYCYSEVNGAVVLIDASTTGWKESGRFTIPKQSSIRSDRGKIWTHPVVSNGKLYLRDQDLLYCFDVKDKAARAK